MGRPSEYSEEILVKCQEYFDIERPTNDEVIPTIEGLSLYLNVARQTIYDWKNHPDKKDFLYIIEKIMAKQGQGLITHGLDGKFNATISKVILTKHGYREGIEQSGPDGGPITIDIEKKAKIDDALSKL